MKILHLVLYNPSPQYDAMYQITKPWYEEWSRQGVDTFYYFYDPYIKEPHICKNTMTLRLPGTETYYPGILMKTLDAFALFAKDGFDFIVRSNISSPINFSVLIQMLKPLPPQCLFYGGPHIIDPYLVETQKNNPLVLAQGKMNFVHGTCIILNPNSLEFILAKRSELETTVEDDLSFGLLFARYKQLPVRVGGQFAFFNSSHNLDFAVTFRNHNVGSTRECDIDAIEHQVTTLFQRYVFLKTKQPVTRVMYADVDVTKKLVERCANGYWTTQQTNAELDVVFGDPKPNVFKNMTIFFKSGDREFKQRCTLTFQVKDNQLWVY